MKRYNNLFDKIVSLDNLYLADKKARRNKSNRKDIKEFDQNKEESLKKLQQDLINGTYKTSEYNTFIIREPKERLIFRLPYYPDRIVHHAVMNIMEPIWVSIFIKDTYSCIKHRGIHEALHNVKEALKDVDNTTYCLKLDIRKFYPSIDHEVLKSIIRKKIKDWKLLQLLDEIIDSAERSMCRKAARLGRKKHITVEDYKQEMCSHIGWLKHCNGINLLKKILRYKELLVYARRFSKQKL